MIRRILKKEKDEDEDEEKRRKNEMIRKPRRRYSINIESEI